MEMLNLIRLIAGLLFLSLGILTFVFEIIGVFKFKYILNRMHFAGTGDTLGLALTIIGSVIICGINFTSLKLVLVLILFWFASPVSSHLIARLVMDTDEKIDEHVKICDLEESLTYMEGKEEEK